MVTTKLITINNGDYFGKIKYGISAKCLPAFDREKKLKQIDTLCVIGGIDEVNDKLSLMCSPVVEDVIHLFVKAGVKTVKNLTLSFTSVRNNEFGISTHRHTVTTSFDVTKTGDIEITNLSCETLPQHLILVTKIERLNSVRADKMLVEEETCSSNVPILYDELVKDLKTIAAEGATREKRITPNIDNPVVEEIKNKYKNDIFIIFETDCCEIGGETLVTSLKVSSSHRSIDNEEFCRYLIRKGLLSRGTDEEVLTNITLSGVYNVHPRNFTDSSEVCDDKFIRVWVFAPMLFRSYVAGTGLDTVDYFALEKVIYNISVYDKPAELEVKVANSIPEDSETDLTVDMVKDDEQIVHITLYKGYKDTQERDTCGVCDILK